MTSFLLRYYFHHMQIWLLCLPIGFILFTSIILLFGQSFTAYVICYVITMLLISTEFLSFTRSYEKMFATMPIPSTSIIQSKFIFLLIVDAMYFVLFTTLYYVHSDMAFLVWVTFALGIYAVTMLLINLVLLFDVIRGKNGLKVIASLIICFIVLMPINFVAILQQLFSKSATSFLALVLMIAITWMNYVFSCRRIKKIDFT